MIVLGYVGKHKGEGFRAWLGWALVRAGQLGYTWRAVTHTEILIEGTPQDATIASSSLVDGGVRTKPGVRLNPANWIAVYVPDSKLRSAAVSAKWFDVHKGRPYDWRGAPGSVLYGVGHRVGSWFCNEACGASMHQVDPHKMPPAGFIAWCLDHDGSRLVTDEFFGGEPISQIGSKG